MEFCCCIVLFGCNCCPNTQLIPFGFIITVVNWKWMYCTWICWLPQMFIAGKLSRKYQCNEFLENCLSVIDTFSLFQSTPIELKWLIECSLFHHNVSFDTFDYRFKGYRVTFLFNFHFCYAFCIGCIAYLRIAWRRRVKTKMVRQMSSICLERNLTWHTFSLWNW